MMQVQNSNKTAAVSKVSEQLDRVTREKDLLQQQIDLQKQLLQGQKPTDSTALSVAQQRLKDLTFEMGNKMKTIASLQQNLQHLQEVNTSLTMQCQQLQAKLVAVDNFRCKGITLKGDRCKNGSGCSQPHHGYLS